MITLDRAASTPVHEQLVEQLRYLIATGRYKPGETLPSTRAMGEQLNLSFHTVRKAYQELEREGLVEARPGSGYTVIERVPLSKSERMERGAAVMQETLQRLIGLGLDEAEMEYLFEEQLALLEGEGERLKLVFAAPYRELAELAGSQVASVVQQPVEAATLDALAHHQDADFVFARMQDVRHVREQIPRADVIGVVVMPGLDALARIARMLDHETLGLVTRYPDAIGPLSAELRAQSGFAGQIVAASVEHGSRHLAQLVPQTDLLLYTPASRRRLLAVLTDRYPHAELTFHVSREALEAIRQALPG
ncbi:MAG: GntR family transcriptional regulator [Rhodothermaceae bacterium]|nr:MAG: GntR family transcriptional regulator [Rhodothermaceae bacterium]